MRVYGLVVALATLSICQAATPTVRFAWKEVDYTWESPEARAQAISNKLFIPSNNLPLALATYKNKMFVSIPRWKAGVASTVNYIDIDGPEEQLLKPYPSFKDNLIADDATELPSNSSLVSVFRMFVDDCERFWVVDTGLADIYGAGHQVSPPAIVIYDLKTDQLIHRYLLKPEDMKEDSFFANIVIDVDKNKCDDAYAYIPDLGAYGVVVYSLKQDDSWRIAHHYFHFDPLAGSYNVSGIEFHWTDGVFALALSEPRDDGYRTMFFHPFSSTKEFCVSTELLRNYKSLDKGQAFHDFKLLGDRGPMTQSASSFYDPKTQVLFYTQVNRDGVACWNKNKPYTLDNNPLIITDPELYEFPNDLKVDNDGIIWILTDKLARFLYKTLDPNVVNYRILSVNASEIIKGTACE